MFYILNPAAKYNVYPSLANDPGFGSSALCPSIPYYAWAFITPPNFICLLRYKNPHLKPGTQPCRTGLRPGVLCKLCTLDKYVPSSKNHRSEAHFVYDIDIVASGINRNTS